MEFWIPTGFCMDFIIFISLIPPYHPYHPYHPYPFLSPLSPLITLILLFLIPPGNTSLCTFFFLMELCLRPISMDPDWIFYGFHGSGMDQFHGSSYGVLPPSKTVHKPRIVFLRISWIWGGCFMEFMDFRYMTMDPDCFFFGFHGSGMDFRWNSWISTGFPWIRTGFSTNFFDLGWIFYEILGFEEFGDLGTRKSSNLEIW